MTSRELFYPLTAEQAANLLNKHEAALENLLKEYENKAKVLDTYDKGNWDSRFSLKSILACLSSISKGTSTDEQQYILYKDLETQVLLNDPVFRDLNKDIDKINNDILLASCGPDFTYDALINDLVVLSSKTKDNKIILEAKKNKKMYDVLDFDTFDNRYTRFQTGIKAVISILALIKSHIENLSSNNKKDFAKAMEDVGPLMKNRPFTNILKSADPQKIDNLMNAISHTQQKKSPETATVSIMKGNGLDSGRIYHALYVKFDNEIVRDAFFRYIATAANAGILIKRHDTGEEGIVRFDMNVGSSKDKQYYVVINARNKIEQVNSNSPLYVYDHTMQKISEFFSVDKINAVLNQDIIENNTPPHIPALGTPEVVEINIEKLGEYVEDPERKNKINILEAMKMYKNQIDHGNELKVNDPEFKHFLTFWDSQGANQEANYRTDCAFIKIFEEDLNSVNKKTIDELLVNVQSVRDAQEAAKRGKYFFNRSGTINGRFKMIVDAALAPKEVRTQAINDMKAKIEARNPKAKSGSALKK